MSGVRIVNIKAYPRIHITLINMTESGMRLNGGVGFSIKDPEIEISISCSQNFKIKDERQYPIDEKQQTRLTEKISCIIKDLRLKSNIEITISGDLPVHSGFGSGTILRLACIEGLLVINNYTYNESLIVKLSGRGGTSGIGVRTYFRGGHVYDIGHRNNGQKLLPSSNKEVDTLQSLLLSEGPMPNWSFGICYPKKMLNKTQSEKEFFIKNSSMTESEVYKTLYHTINEVLSGIKEEDRYAFEIGINSLQNCAWKKAERELYFGQVQHAEQILSQNGATMIGMSSLGPGLFFWGTKDINDIIKDSKHHLSGWHFLNTTANNKCRILIVKDA
jgi:beta-ribofuranosylaminobenzene 5'-phosphate synthase